MEPLQFPKRFKKSDTNSSILDTLSATTSTPSTSTGKKNNEQRTEGKPTYVYTYLILNFILDI